MRILLASFLFLLLNSTCAVATPPPSAKAQSEEEALYLRRIVEFLRDGQDPLAKQQILDFREKYPNSPFQSDMAGLLGNIYYQEGDYQAALDEYQQLSNGQLAQSVEDKIMHCLLKLEKYSDLLTITHRAAKMPLKDLEEGHYPYVFYHGAALMKTNILEQRDLQLALKLLESLEDTEYRGRALPLIADLYASLGDNETSAETYIELVELYPDKRRPLLLQAAMQLAKVDSKRAQGLYRDLIGDTDAIGEQALTQWLDLTFSVKDYASLYSGKKQLLEQIQPDFSWHLLVYLGRAHLAQGQFKQAYAYFLEVLEHDASEWRGLNQTNLRQLFLYTGAALYNLKQLDALQLLYARYESRFAMSPEGGYLLFWQVLLLEHNNEAVLAKEKLDQLDEYFPYFADQAGLLYVKGLVYFDLGWWEQCHQSMSSLLALGGNAMQMEQGQRRLLQASWKLYEQAEQLGVPNQMEQYRVRFKEEVAQLLSSSGASFPELEREFYYFQLGKMLFEEGSYEQALVLLNGQKRELSSPDQGFQTHLLMAACYEKQGDWQGFAEQAEKVLQLNPELPEGVDLHLRLYNLYLSWSQTALKVQQPERQEQLLVAAADHLLAVVLDHKEQVTITNQIWLSRFFVEQARVAVERRQVTKLDNQLVKAWIQKGRRCLHAILGADSIKCRSVEEEDLVLYLALLEGYAGRHERKITLLEGLTKQYQRQGWPWQRVTSVYAELGEAYYLLGKGKLALKALDRVLQTEYRLDPIAVSQSQLLKARIIGKMDSSKSSSAANQALELYKTLQIRRSLSQEPLHLEAAIEYAELAAEQDDGNTEQRLIELLNRLKTEFSARNTIQAKDYHASRELLPQKDKVYLAYMMYIDAKLAVLKGKSAAQDASILEALSHWEAASSLYDRLVEGEYAVSKYLVDRTLFELQELQLLQKNEHIAITER